MATTQAWIGASSVAMGRRPMRGDGQNFRQPLYSGSIMSIDVVIVHASSAGIRFSSWPGPQESE